MDLLKIDNVMSLAAIVGHLALVIVLVKQKSYKEFPIFFAFVLFALLEDPVTLLLMRNFNAGATDIGASPTYFRFSQALQVPEYLLGLGLLLEISRNVLQPVRRSLPKGALVLFAGLIVVGALVSYSLAGRTEGRTLLTSVGSLYVKITLINAILTVVSFIVLALFAQMLGIGWKNHVLQLATGLAFYGAVDLIVRLIQSRLAAGVNVAAYADHYRSLDRIRVLSYLSTVTFWCWSFYHQEAPRREFSPRMAQFLVSISGVAKKDRSQFGR